MEGATVAPCTSLDIHSLTTHPPLSVMKRSIRYEYISIYRLASGLTAEDVHGALAKMCALPQADICYALLLCSALLYLSDIATL